jgi:hypothetical protein
MINKLSRQIVWHGTNQEALDLLGAVQHNCTCSVDDAAVLRDVCPAHQMLVEGQRLLDGLLFARSIAARLQREEFGSTRVKTSRRSRRVTRKQ